VERDIPMLFAINEALHLAMESDPDVIVLGEDVAGGGGRRTRGSRRRGAGSWARRAAS
jgi:pyruvate/2-oxoglutarate/acetoin dehydrogenase E1 component